MKISWVASVGLRAPEEGEEDGSDMVVVDWAVCVVSVEL